MTTINARRAIGGLLLWPASLGLGLLVLPWLFRAVFFLERVIGAWQ